MSNNIPHYSNPVAHGDRLSLINRLHMATLNLKSSAPSGSLTKALASAIPCLWPPEI